MVSGQAGSSQQIAGILILGGKPYRLVEIPPALCFPAGSMSAVEQETTGTAAFTATWEVVDGLLCLVVPDATRPDGGGHTPATDFSGCLRYISHRLLCGVCWATLAVRISVLAFEHGVLVAQYEEVPERSEADIPAFLRRKPADDDGMGEAG